MISIIQQTRKAVKVASSEDITFYRVEQSTKKLRIYRHTHKIVEAFLNQDKEAIKSIGNNLKPSDIKLTEVFKN